MVDFTTLHPFDFDRNLFNFLVCALFSLNQKFAFVLPVKCSSYHARTEPESCFHHWFSFPVVDGFSLLVAKNNCYISSPTHACMQ